MQNKYCFDAVSTTLADILGNELHFGGIPVILGGDFARHTDKTSRPETHK
jgi:hypothetical protein